MIGTSKSMKWKKERVLIGNYGTPPTKASSKETSPLKSSFRIRKKIIENEMNKIITSLFSYEFENIERYIIWPSEKIEELFSEVYYQILTIVINLCSYSDKIQKSLAINLNHFKAKFENINSYFIKHHSLNFDSLRPLTTFRKHCSNCDEMAKHKCADLLYVIDNEFVVCKTCGIIYRNNKIECYCSYDECIYFSLSLQEDTAPLATWHKYHCGLINYERMKCSCCSTELLLDLKSGDVKCQNIRCNFKSNSQTIPWCCKNCNTCFHSRAVIYNSIEFDYLNQEIKKALLSKQTFIPKQKDKCRCVGDFVHSRSCQGNLLMGKFHGEDTVVCDKCHKFFYYEKFEWNCEKCKRKNRMLVEEKDVREQKTTTGMIGVFKRTNSGERKKEKRVTVIENMKNSSIKHSNNFGRFRKQSEQKKKANDLSLVSFSKNKNSSVNKKEEFIKGNKDRDREKEKDREKKRENEREHGRKTFKIKITKGKSLSPQNLTNELNLNEFNIITEIGCGSYATVYLVSENDTGKKFALKKLIANNKEELSQYKGQISLVNSIGCNGIVQILKYFINRLDSTTYVVYLLLPLAECDWSQKIEAGHKYTQKDLMQILTQLINTLAFLQSNMICHRDIKPQNIFIYDHGKKFLLADFDETIRVKDHDTFTPIKGTRMFMSPLLFDGHKEGSTTVKHNLFKSDVFSLGFCFVFAMTNNYEVLSDLRTVDKQRQYDILNEIQKRNNYSEEFMNIIRKMVVIDERERLDFVQLNQIVNKI